MIKKTHLTIFILLFAAFAGAQTAEEKKQADTEAEEKLRKEAVLFIRETLTDVNTMRSLENRISFTAEMAGLMWFHDEREARSMYNGAIGDFRDLVLRYDTQMNGLGITTEDGESADVNPFGFLIEPTDKGRVLRKIRSAIVVGQQIAMSLAEHDPELGYSFYYDSLSAISNPEFKRTAEQADSQFETKILDLIAQNNPSKAGQLGRKSLAKGFARHHIELLRKIHAKDPEKGIEFAAAILSQIKSEKIERNDFYALSGLVDFGSESLEASRKQGGKKPAFTAAEMREIVEIFAQALLNGSPESYEPASYVDKIQKYSPGRAAQIRAKFKITNSSSANSNSRGYGVPPPYPMNTSAYGSEANSNSANTRWERERREYEEREKAAKKLEEDVKALGEKQLPKEERDKVVAQARKIISQTPGRDKKIGALAMLAAQVSKLGDKALAAEIMKDAEAMVNPAPKNFQDYLLVWMLASGYAHSDPDKAFPILEDTIGRANETLSAFIKVAEFIDVAEQMVQDGEVQVGAFGGDMVRGMTRELGIADSTIQVLARADFAKTKNLTNRFDRTEIRVLAKMMILRAVLSKKEAPKAEEMIEAMGEEIGN